MHLASAERRESPCLDAVYSVEGQAHFGTLLRIDADAKASAAATGCHRSGHNEKAPRWVRDAFVIGWDFEAYRLRRRSAAGWNATFAW